MEEHKGAYGFNNITSDCFVLCSKAGLTVDLGKLFGSKGSVIR